MKPFLVVFFGIDGSGKSTQANLLYEHLSAQNVDVSYCWSRREAYLTKLPAFIIKKLILKERGRSDGKSYTVIKKNRKTLFSNKFFRPLWLFGSLLEYLLLTYFRVVLPNRNREFLICDRYLQDALADFAVAGRKDVGKLYSNIICRFFPSPDLLFFIDISAAEGCARKNDGTLPIETIQGNIREAVNRHLLKKKGIISESKS